MLDPQHCFNTYYKQVGRHFSLREASVQLEVAGVAATKPGRALLPTVDACRACSACLQEAEAVFKDALGRLL